MACMHVHSLVQLQGSVAEYSSHCTERHQLADALLLLVAAPGCGVAGCCPFPHMRHMRSSAAAV